MGEQTMAKIAFTLLLLLSVMGCKTVGYHWIKDKETGELELVEVIETRGTGKHDVTFATKGSAKSDSGFKIPDLNIELDKLKD